jgi:hypothetical protein
MSQYQSYSQRTPQQSASQPQASQPRPQAPNVQITTNLYIFCLSLVLLEMLGAIKIKQFKKQSYNGQALETVEEMLLSTDNLILLY